jgi:aryl-alcohol dehydrogenase-like predicted oxidoreductase
MRAFDDLVSQGKILYTGISDAPAWWIAQANTLASFRGWSPFIGLQIEYSLMERTVERELIPMAKALGLGLVAWSPLGGGVLSGKYNEAQTAENARYSTDMMKGFMPDADRQATIVHALRAVSGETGCSLAQVALAWLRYRDVPVFSIIGARKLAQVQDNMDSLSLELTAQQVKSLDDASGIQLGFPHDFYANPMVRGLVYGGLRDRIML